MAYAVREILILSMTEGDNLQSFEPGPPNRSMKTASFVDWTASLTCESRYGVVAEKQIVMRHNARMAVDWMKPISLSYGWDTVVYRGSAVDESNQIFVLCSPGKLSGYESWLSPFSLFRVTVAPYIGTITRCEQTTVTLHRDVQ